MNAIQTKLINAMEAERARRQLNHKEFSTLLKISKSYWTMLRKGQRHPSLFVLQTILQQVPELGDYVDSYMRQGNDGEKNNPAKPKTMPHATERASNGH